MKNEDIDKIVNMLDANIKNGVGHINLKSSESQDELFKEVKAEECGINTPCQIPNFDQIQDKENLWHKVNKLII